MCGLIIEQLGWEAVFYITAGITVLWVIIWQVRDVCVCQNMKEGRSTNLNPGARVGAARGE